MRVSQNVTAINSKWFYFGKTPLQMFWAVCVVADVPVLMIKIRNRAETVENGGYFVAIKINHQ